MRAGASTLGTGGLCADQGRDASKARHASNARDVGNARRRQTVSITFVARRSSIAA